MELTVLGERLHTVRRRQNLSQSDLAMKAAVTVTTISGIESRGVDVRGSTLVALAKALGVSTDYLLGLWNDPEPWGTARKPDTPPAVETPTPAAVTPATPRRTTAKPDKATRRAKASPSRD